MPESAARYRSAERSTFGGDERSPADREPGRGADPVQGPARPARGGSRGRVEADRAPRRRLGRWRELRATRGADKSLHKGENSGSLVPGIAVPDPCADAV